MIELTSEKNSPVLQQAFTLFTAYLLMTVEYWVSHPQTNLYPVAAYLLATAYWVSHPQTNLYPAGCLPTGDSLLSLSSSNIHLPWWLPTYWWQHIPMSLIRSSNRPLSCWLPTYWWQWVIWYLLITECYQVSFIYWIITNKDGFLQIRVENCQNNNCHLPTLFPLVSSIAPGGYQLQVPWGRVCNEVIAGCKTLLHLKGIHGKLWSDPVI